MLCATGLVAVHKLSTHEHEPHWPPEPDGSTGAPWQPLQKSRCQTEVWTPFWGAPIVTIAPGPGNTSSPDLQRRAIKRPPRGGSRKRRRHDCARSSPQAHSRSGPGRAAPTWRPQVCPPGPRSASASGPRCVWSVRRLPLRPRHRGKQVSLSLGARHCLGAGCWVAWVPGRRRSGRSSSDRFVFRDLACEPPMIFF